MERILRQFSELVDRLPFWGQVLIAIGLVAFSLISVYGRINPAFGAKVFSKIPAEEIRSNRFHITRYTVVPVFVTVFYLFLILDN